jgi:hypothetical protein
MSENEFRTEEFKVNGEAVVAKLKEIIHEGNVRRIILKDEKGNILIEVPLSIGVVGIVLLPVWAAIGAVAAMAANLTIVVEKAATPAPTTPEEPAKEIKVEVKGE